MFKAEREMQNKFVSLLKKRKTCGLIFEEVGNRNYFFRTDVVEYKGRNNIIGYELKLKDFHKLIEQCLKTMRLYNKTYMVIPENKLDSLLLAVKHYKNKNIDKIGIITLNNEKHKIIRQACDTRDYSDSYTCTLVSDLIIRGYHKDGMNSCKSYKWRNIKAKAG